MASTSEATIRAARCGSIRAVVVYAGYLGGGGDNIAYGIAVDSAGNAYVTGETITPNSGFPDGDGVGPLASPDPTYNGGLDDAFVAKVNAEGTALVYAGYLGGNEEEIGFDIAVDGAGNAYVVGYTTSTEASFPTGDGLGSLSSPDPTFNGLADAFVVKVNAAGTDLVYAGYIGGSEFNRALGVDVDSEGNAYLTGVTASSEATFPDGDGFGSLSGPDVTLNGNGIDAFVVKVNTAGTAFVYAGYVGGDELDAGSALDLDDEGNVYVTGNTLSLGLRALPGTATASAPCRGPSPTFNGQGDAFVAKLNASGTGYLYAGYLGGTSVDVSTSIAVDPMGNAYVTGFTDSAVSFPTGDGFGALPESGSHLQWPHRCLRGEARRGGSGGATPASWVVPVTNRAGALPWTARGMPT